MEAATIRNEEDHASARPTENPAIDLHPELYPVSCSMNSDWTSCPAYLGDFVSSRAVT